jgi:hypothetical protein
MENACNMENALTPELQELLKMTDKFFDILKLRIDEN